MAVFDSSFLSLLLFPDAGPIEHPETREPITQAKERVQHLVETISKGSNKIIIPTPVLSEFLVIADEAGTEYIGELQKKSVFEIAPFDKRAAIELAIRTREALNNGDKRDGQTDPWQKIKIDRQIAAIAFVHDPNGVLYSTDTGLCHFARLAGLEAKGLHEIVPPPVEQQQPLALNEPEGNL